MHSSIVDYEDYLRFRNGDENNNIQKFFERIKGYYMPHHMLKNAGEFYFSIEKDKKAPNNHYAVRYRFKMHTDFAELEEYFKTSGPYIIYVKQF